MIFFRKSIISKVFLFILLFIISTDVLIDYIEILSDDLVVIQTQEELQRPHRFSPLDNSLSLFLFTDLEEEETGKCLLNQSKLSFIINPELDSIGSKLRSWYYYFFSIYYSYSEYNIPPPQKLFKITN